MSNDKYYWPSERWRTASPNDVGIDVNLLHDANRYIQSQAKRINSLLIIKDGYLVTENYYNRYSQATYDHICSVTKSIISALIGIAIDNGHIESVDQPILDIFTHTDPRQTHYLLQAITVKHLLLMSSGVMSRYNRNGNEPLWERMESTHNWVDFILSLPISNDNLNKFSYTSMNSHLLSAIITHTTGMSAAEYANKYLFCSIGIPITHSRTSLLNAINVDTVSSWQADPQGINNGGFGLYLRPIDLANFGYLYVREGKWRDKQVISSEWIHKSIQTKANKTNYGFHWWLESEFNGYSAQGFGGQSIYVIPDYDLVIVMTSKSDSKASAGRTPADILKKFILPSLK